MKSKEPLIDVLQEVVLKMNCLITILSATNTGGNDYTLVVCDVLYAQAGFKVKIGGVEYTIKEVIWAKNKIIVTGASAITATQFLLYRPFFFHGTPIDTGTDLAKIMNLGNKTPMVWLLETFEEEFNENDEEENERSSPVRLFFLTQSDLTKRPEALQKDYVECMTRLKDVFIETLQACFGRIDTVNLNYSTKYYPKFGVYVSNKGVDSKLWADNLSGCEIDPTILLYKANNCCGSREQNYFANEEETFIFTDENGVPFTSEL